MWVKELVSQLDEEWKHADQYKECLVIANKYSKQPEKQLDESEEERLRVETAKSSKKIKWFPGRLRKHTMSNNAAWKQIKRSFRSKNT